MEKIKSTKKIAKIDKITILENRNVSMHAEAVASFIIEKLISYTISESYRLEIDAKIGNNCFNFLKKIIDQSLTLSYITTDRDDTNFNFNNINNFKPPNEILYNRLGTDMSNKFINENNLNENIDANISISDHTIQRSHTNSVATDYNAGALLDNNSVASVSNLNNEKEAETKFKKLCLTDTQENEHLLLIENEKHFFDNYYRGINDWSVFEPPVKLI